LIDDDKKRILESSTHKRIKLRKQGIWFHEKGGDMPDRGKRLTKRIWKTLCTHNTKSNNKAHIILPKACQIDFEKFGNQFFLYN
jgi:hypothetical protein